MKSGHMKSPHSEYSDTNYCETPIPHETSCLMTVAAGKCLYPPKSIHVYGNIRKLIMKEFFLI